MGTSPLELGLATLDLISHLALSPGKRLQLSLSLIAKLVALGAYSAKSIRNKDAEGPASQIERRMSGEAWNKWPFKVMAQGHQLSKKWWAEAAFGVDGVQPNSAVAVHSAVEQIIDMFSPANTLLTNPEVIKTTINERGKNRFYYLMEES